MRVTPHVLSIWHGFEIELPGGVRIPRFVPSYIIEGERLAAVDTAVEPAVPRVLSWVGTMGRRPEEVEWVVNTHCHFDHVGSNGAFARPARALPAPPGPRPGPWCPSRKRFRWG